MWSMLPGVVPEPYSLRNLILTALPEGKVKVLVLVFQVVLLPVLVSVVSILRVLLTLIEKVELPTDEYRVVMV